MTTVASTASDAPPVELRVVWADFTRVPADVHAVGHYQGVMPASAEAALDRAISGPNARRHIIAEHTRQQWFMGDFGHVNYFPSRHDVVRQAAVAGMGRPGTFSEARCERLAENLLVELSAVGTAGTLAMVGIGSGAGNLSFEQTARAMTAGFAAALRSSRLQQRCTRIDVVEWDRLRAERFFTAFRANAAAHPGLLVVPEELVTGEGGGIGFSSASVYGLEALVRAAAAEGGPAAVGAVLDQLGDPALRDLVVGSLSHADPVRVVEAAEVSIVRRAVDDEPPPMRISVLEENGDDTLRVAAITGTATVPERQIEADPRLIDDIIARMNPPREDELQDLAELMSRMVLPSDLQALVSPDYSIVFEVDRRTAQIHWELVVDLDRRALSGEGAVEPLVLRTSIARQLRTAYSHVPPGHAQLPEQLRVLVVGDPGGPGQTLAGARTEALEVHRLLDKMGIAVTTLIGAPGEEEPGFQPAARLDVLRELLSGDYQVVHYCGHGTFDPKDQGLAGWLFADGLLTSRELRQLAAPPRLVMANACFTSQLGSLPDRDDDDGPAAGRPRAPEALLTPSLADEFFRCGTTNYIGAAWAVDDEDAVLLSTTFYELLLGEGATVGEALLAARNAVWKRHAGADPPTPVGTTWAAYQHYGDPNDRALAAADG
jgi:hypothetical protein